MLKTKIYITDDHTILRDGLKVLLRGIPSYEVVGESGDGEEALKEIGKLKPDIVILDISLPTISGIEVCRQIRKSYPEIKIIILSRHNNEVYIEELLAYGIAGYVLKENAVNDLTRAIDASAKGNIYLSPEITRQVVSDYKKSKQGSVPICNKLDLLSNQEKSVLKLLAEGNSNKEIAKLLCISAITVKKHRSNIMKKLNIHNLAELVVFAIKHGLREV